MTELEKLLSNEQSFQRIAVFVAALLLLGSSLPLSIARAMFGPAEQIAAVVSEVPSPIIKVQTTPEPVRYVRRVLARSGGRTRFAAPTAAAPQNEPLPGAVPLMETPAALAPADSTPPPAGPAPLLAINDPLPTRTPEITGAVGPGSVSGLSPVSPIPEPMTWMMMILGVGVVGATLRRARQAGNWQGTAASAA